MNSLEIIQKKRDGESLSDIEIDFLIKNYSSGKIPDYQFAAFLMAGFLNGLDKRETSALTKSMLHSGKIVNLSSIKESKIDKHSTGGVGDKTSLIIAPIVASAGIYVPMISGRGLGHTGGTLDKLESIPGFKTNLNLNEFKSVLKKCGAVLIGQTKEIAPADKMIYSLRSATATIESVPFITASIMSKKLAEGIDGLVLDVKTGSGAFMKNEQDALALARSLISTAKSFNKNVIAFITDMNQPLGNYIGNWLEVYESVNVLRGDISPDLYELSVTLAGAMIYLGGKADTVNEGKEISKQIIASGNAYKKFLEIVKLQGGDISVIKNPDRYPKSKYTMKLYSPASGYLKGINSYELGMTALELGAGRLTKDENIDHKAGIVLNVKMGDHLKKDMIIGEIRTDKKNEIDKALNRIYNSFEFSKVKVNKIKLIKKTIY